MLLSLVHRSLPLGRHLASLCRNGTHFRKIPPVFHHQHYLPHPFNCSAHSIRCFLGGIFPPCGGRVSSDFAYAESQVAPAQPGDEYSLSLCSCAVDPKRRWRRMGRSARSASDASELPEDPLAQWPGSCCLWLGGFCEFLSGFRRGSNLRATVSLALPASHPSESSQD